MEIGIISDTHNRRVNLQNALQILRARKLTHLVHCGDLTDPHLIQFFAGFQFFFAFGNGDFAYGEIEHEIKRVHKDAIVGDELRFTLAGKRFYVAHGNAAIDLSDAIESGGYDYVLSGHTHRFSDVKHGTTRAINPGAIGGSRGDYGFAILDVETGFVEQIRL